MVRHQSAKLLRATLVYSAGRQIFLFEVTIKASCNDLSWDLCPVGRYKSPALFLGSFYVNDSIQVC